MCNKFDVYESGIESVYLISEEDQKPLWFCCHTCMQMMKHLLETYSTDKNGQKVIHAMDKKVFTHLMHSVYRKNEKEKEITTCEICVAQMQYKVKK
ncbi:Hypothetical protein KVN_LOCUS292 [uncultured virus]|nr:Hypothetical protein KVN_LOCUS292 [uncultured virus]